MSFSFFYTHLFCYKIPHWRTGSNRSKMELFQLLNGGDAGQTDFPVYRYGTAATNAVVTDAVMVIGKGRVMILR